MTSIEAQCVVRTLILAFPNVADDPVRIRDITRRLEPYPVAVAQQGVDEYIRVSDAKWFEISRLMPVVDRIRRQHQDREADVERQRQMRIELLTQAQQQQRLAEADKVIALMSDADVTKEAESIIFDLELKGAAMVVEWAKQRKPEQWRHNFALRIKVAGMLEPSC